LIPNDEKYPPEDLSIRNKTEMAASRQRRWEEGENAMKERKKKTGWQNATEKLKRRDQVAVTRLRTGYSRTTYRNKMEGTPNPDCPFCSAKLTLEHILSRKQRKKDERVIRRKKYERKEKKKQKCSKNM
jgi:hypothetical protein